MHAALFGILNGGREESSEHSSKLFLTSPAFFILVSTARFVPKHGGCRDIEIPNRSRLVFLASPASDMVTGHTLAIDGGLTAV
jgi:hypothetical protein